MTCNTKFDIGAKVFASEMITESGQGKGDPTSKFPDSHYIHARKGDSGVVEGIDDGHATVRFQPSNTATIVSDSEIVPESEFLGGI